MSPQRLNVVHKLDRIWKSSNAIYHPEGQTGPSELRLIVFVHGFHSVPQKYQGLLTSIHDIVPDAAMFAFNYPSGLLSRSSPDRVVDELRAQLAKFAEQYREVTLVSHSMGTLLVRRAVLDIMDESWVQRIKQSILLASTNRGYQPYKPTHLLGDFLARRWIWLLVGIVTGILFAVCSQLNPGLCTVNQWTCAAAMIGLLCFLVFDHSSGFFVERFLRGSDWIARLRVDWIRKFSGGTDHLPTQWVHIRGELDRTVAADDNHELFLFKNTRELTVPGVKHGHFLMTPRWWRKKSDESSNFNVKTRLVDALTDVLMHTTSDSAAYRGKVVTGAGELNLADASYFELDRSESFDGDDRSKPTLVVWLVHGIRDFADWEDTLEYRINESAREKGLVPKVMTYRYGYFTALQFVLVSERYRAAKGFVDRYVQEIARYPNAAVVVAAHSNGTWVIGEAIKKPFVDFERVYMAGSVLPRTFWGDAFQLRAKHQRSGSPGAAAGGVLVRNDCGSEDWPVGALCWLLTRFGLGRYHMYPTLGTAGIHGFKEWDGGNLHQNWLSGGHGVALLPQYHRDIARFLAGDSDAMKIKGSLPPGQLNTYLLGPYRLGFVLGAGTIVFLLLWLSSLGWFWIGILLVFVVLRVLIWL